MFENAAQFSMHIEQLAADKRMTHMEAVLHYCAQNYLEPDEVKSLINKPLRDKIAEDARAANLLPRQATLNV